MVRSLQQYRMMNIFMLIEQMGLLERSKLQLRMFLAGQSISALCSLHITSLWCSTDINATLCIDVTTTNLIHVLAGNQSYEETRMSKGNL